MGRRTGTRRKDLNLWLNKSFMKIIKEGWITRNKEIMTGKPWFKRTGITVELILMEVIGSAIFSNF